MIKKILFSMLLFVGFALTETESQNLTLNNDLNFYYENSVNFDSSFHFTVKPYRKKIFPENAVAQVSASKKILYDFFNNDMLNVDRKNINIKINPVSSSMFFYDLSEKKYFSEIKAGFSVFFSYKNKLFFNSDIFVSQAEFPSFLDYLPDDYGIVPYYGKISDKKGTELRFLSWTGDLVYDATENISFSVGRNKNFIGNGYRSLFLSDNSNAYPYLKAEVDIWKIKYLWTAVKLSDVNISGYQNSVILYDKAAFIHYLSVNLTKHINFNFFEAVVTNPFDSEGRRISYDAVYFNPVIFYRPAEFYNGTSDNSLMGAGLNIRLLKSTIFYSQFILDDLVISSLKDGSGWWGNKYGFQAGVKAYNLFGVKGLFGRGEINVIRPYTYSHGEAYVNNGIANLNYGNYAQALAHPLGANFAEGIAEIRYLKGRFSGKARLILSKKGEDTDTVSMGGNIYKSYALRPDDYGISLLQGEETDISVINVSFSYLINPEYNLMFKTGVYYRKEKNSVYTKENNIIYLGISSCIFNSFYD